MRTIILAIKPKFARDIYSKKKTIEFRRVIPKCMLPENEGRSLRALLYESAPVQRITGECILRVAAFSFGAEFQQYIINQGCISKQDLKKYSGIEEAKNTFRKPKGLFALRVEWQEKYEYPFKLQDLLPYETIKPPQNFMYFDKVPFLDNNNLL